MRVHVDDVIMMTEMGLNSTLETADMPLGSRDLGSRQLQVIMVGDVVGVIGSAHAPAVDDVLPTGEECEAVIDDSYEVIREDVRTAKI